MLKAKEKPAKLSEQLDASMPAISRVYPRLCLKTSIRVKLPEVFAVQRRFETGSRVFRVEKNSNSVGSQTVFKASDSFSPNIYNGTALRFFTLPRQ